MKVLGALQFQYILANHSVQFMDGENPLWSCPRRHFVCIIFPHIFGTNESKTHKIPCLIPYAIDQDPYFRMTRDVAARLHFAKPALIHARFLDALQGPGSKMSASVEFSAIIMKDQPNQIMNKINKYAFSGGQVTEAEQRELGGDTDKDVSY
jgi:tryptophanyl-tRNA synthetase